MWRKTLIAIGIFAEPPMQIHDSPIQKRGAIMEKYCHSCSSPLWMEQFQGPAEKYCKYCTDESGNLKPREEILKGCASWLKSWSPDLDDQTALKRAAHYMKAMPEWAED